jgi:hypothetical protein
MRGALCHPSIQSNEKGKCQADFDGTMEKLSIFFSFFSPPPNRCLNFRENLFRNSQLVLWAPI